MARLPYHWRERMCQMLLVPLKPQTMRFLTAWSRCEGGFENDWKGAQNNPLNTQYAMPGSSDFNSIGVKNYVTPVEGICAQAATMARNPDYLELWKELQWGQLTAEELLERNRVAIATWGTDTDLFARVLREV